MILKEISLLCLIVVGIECTVLNVDYFKSYQSNFIPLGNDTRIVGGQPVEISSYRYHASFQYWHRHICGAVLISSRWVLTAAHCTRAFTIPPPRYAFTVRLGTTFQQNEGFVFSIAEIIDHPQYVQSTIDYDISLMRLGREATFSSTIGPIPLPTRDQALVPGSVCTITGWGALEWRGITPAGLQMVQVPLISNENCNEYYPSTIRQRITDRMMCAGSPYGGRDACQRDSGGPLAVDGVLIGIVSWGFQCAAYQAPGVYANVVFFRDWINEHTGL
ncbi:trypsin-3-like [Sitophilus oryzae]|uniref:Trypsin-3-like n=1 Tax=Sitophilus oryzae TaxID=7048 RepID=A0A6J2XP12_SITOR|nr:trypsin-3-like [Sitophilus oryzae]